MIRKRRRRRRRLAHSVWDADVEDADVEDTLLYTKDVHGRPVCFYYVTTRRRSCHQRRQRCGDGSGCVNKSSYDVYSTVRISSSHFGLHPGD